MMREVSLETLPNINIRDPSHNKNLPIKTNSYFLRIASKAPVRIQQNLYTAF